MVVVVITTVAAISWLLLLSSPWAKSLLRVVSCNCHTALWTGEWNGNPLQYSCLDRGAWRSTVHTVAKSRTRLKPLSIHAHSLNQEDTRTSLRSCSKDMRTWLVLSSPNTLPLHNADPWPAPTELLRPKQAPVVIRIRKTKLISLTTHQKIAREHTRSYFLPIRLETKIKVVESVGNSHALLRDYKFVLPLWREIWQDLLKF